MSLRSASLTCLSLARSRLRKRTFTSKLSTLLGTQQKARFDGSKRAFLLSWSELGIWRLALLVDGFFLLGAFFLFFFLEFVAYQFKDGHFGVVADAMAGVDDACIAACAVGKFRRDFTE